MRSTVELERRVACERVFRRYFPLFLSLWILFVLYPNPLSLVISFHRLFNPDVDPAAVEPLVADLPSTPSAIEKAIMERIPYSYDWELHDMPWYFPTTETVVEKRRGDCKARAIVLASIFENKHIPYRINSSPIHVWVEYEDKEETPLENPRVKFYQQDPETGERLFQIPDIDLSEVLESFHRGFWVAMPGIRRALLLSGVCVLVLLRVILLKKPATGY